MVLRPTAHHIEPPPLRFLATDPGAESLKQNDKHASQGVSERHETPHSGHRDQYSDAHLAFLRTAEKLLRGQGFTKLADAVRSVADLLRSTRVSREPAAVQNAMRHCQARRLQLRGTLLGSSQVASLLLLAVALASGPIFLKLGDATRVTLSARADSLYVNQGAGVPPGITSRSEAWAFRFLGELLSSGQKYQAPPTTIAAAFARPKLKLAKKRGSSVIATIDLLDVERIDIPQLASELDKLAAKRATETREGRLAFNSAGELDIKTIDLHFGSDFRVDDIRTLQALINDSAEGSAIASFNQQVISLDPPQSSTWNRIRQVQLTQGGNYTRWNVSGHLRVEKLPCVLGYANSILETSNAADEAVSIRGLHSRMAWRVFPATADEIEDAVAGRLPERIASETRVYGQQGWIMPMPLVELELRQVPQGSLENQAPRPLSDFLYLGDIDERLYFTSL